MPIEHSVLDKGVLDFPPLISDHMATDITVPFDYPLTSSYKRVVWLYKRGNYKQLQENIESYDWNFINDAPIDDVAKIFEDTFLGLVNDCIPSKEVTIHTDDKPWYDSVIKNIQDLEINFDGKLLKLKIKRTSRLTNLLVIKSII